MKPTKNNSVLVVSKGQRCGVREELVTLGVVGGDGRTHSSNNIFPGAHLDPEGRHCECHRAPYCALSAVVSRRVSTGPLRLKSPFSSSQLSHPRSHHLKATQPSPCLAQAPSAWNSGIWKQRLLPVGHGLWGGGGPLSRLPPLMDTCQSDHGRM